MEPDISDSDSKTPDNGLSLAESLRYRWAKCRIRFTSLWTEIRDFGGWIEHEALPAAKQANQQILRLRVAPDGVVHALGPVDDQVIHSAPNRPRLAEFLLGLGLGRLELDLRLERNQIEDVLVMLFACRPGLAARRAHPPRGRAARLTGEHGIHLACTETQITDDTLTISYSYCLTRFSRIVHWFERRHVHFSDHRALFHAAPRYGLLAVVVVSGPLAVYLLYHTWWTMVLVTGLEAAILFAMFYLFFMAIGSVEYDNEEKAFRLNRTYNELKRYADRIQEDIQRARTVQEKILPESDHMPLPGHVEWASSFVPEIEVGGDYFDAVGTAPHRAAILFADVSGHGMGAAFVTAILKTTFQAWADESSDLADLVRRLNRTLCRITPDDSFAAVFVAAYDVQAHKLTYINCGHQPEPWLIRADGQPSLRGLSDARNLLLGVEGDLDVIDATVTLQSGDMLLFVSDGLIEARDVGGRMYGIEPFEQSLRNHPPETARHLVDQVVRQVDTFSKNAPQTDDQTVLAMRIL